MIQSIGRLPCDEFSICYGALSLALVFLLRTWMKQLVDNCAARQARLCVSTWLIHMRTSMCRWEYIRMCTCGHKHLSPFFLLLDHPGARSPCKAFVIACACLCTHTHRLARGVDDSELFNATTSSDDLPNYYDVPRWFCDPSRRANDNLASAMIKYQDASERQVCPSNLGGIT